MRNCERVSQGIQSLSIEVNNFFERTVIELAQLRQYAKGLSIGSNRSSSSKSFGFSSKEANKEAAGKVGEEEEEDVEVKKIGLSGKLG